jgi:hypothetical protein
MNENLKTILVVIGFLAILYYFFSPYQTCLRSNLPEGYNASVFCANNAKW